MNLLVLVLCGLYLIWMCQFSWFYFRLICCVVDDVSLNLCVELYLGILLYVFALAV